VDEPEQAMSKEDLKRAVRLWNLERELNPCRSCEGVGFLFPILRGRGHKRIRCSYCSGIGVDHGA
jgi:hypothetical protein